MSCGSAGPLSEPGGIAVAGAPGRTEPEEAASNLEVCNRKSLAPAAEAAQAEQLQRAAIIGQLVGGILHDFNNVLTVITGMIDLVAQAVADQPQLAGPARLIDEAASRGAALTARLLALARGQPAEPREVDVALLLDEAVRLLRPALSGIEVVARNIQAPPALADSGQLMAAILSLAITARNAMPEGGRLVLSAQPADAPDGSAFARTGHAEDAMMIAVDAHGYGEVAQHPESIFSDVGISRDFVARCGGRLDLSASSGECARVEILVPRARDG